MSEGADAVVRDYYDALRQGASLEPYFLEDGSTVKFGISEGLFGYDAVADALREQTATTEEWSIESGHLVVEQRPAFATVADEVTMAWTDTASGDRNRFDTRWSGTLIPAADDSPAPIAGENGPEWLFASMHVSAPSEL